MNNYEFYNKDQGKFRKGDLIIIPFNEKIPSIYRVESARGKKLIVTVLEDNYYQTTQPGTVLDLGLVIYEGWWCHRRIANVKPKGKVRQEKP